MSVTIKNDRLFFLLDPTELVEQRHSRHDHFLGLHFGEVLKNFRISYGIRPVLAYTLAKAVWHHYDSDWLRMGKTRANVCFCKPYLSN